MTLLKILYRWLGWHYWAHFRTASLWGRKCKLCGRVEWGGGIWDLGDGTCRENER